MREKMKRKKIMLILITAIFFASIAGVCASDANDTMVANDDTGEIELSHENEMSADNLQTGKENDELALADNDESVSAQTGTEVLSVDNSTYLMLSSEISQPGNVKLTHKNYVYDNSDPITIREDNKVIDGNGAVIDMAGSTIRAFDVISDGVTIKNLTIKNVNFWENGGAIKFAGDSGAVINCNFINNTAKNGGAIYIEHTGNVENCNFTDNHAVQNGGAIYGGISVFNNFKTSSDTIYNTNFPTFTVSKSLFRFDLGEKLLFNLTADNKNYDGYNTTITLIKDGNPVGVYYALSGSDEGWSADLSPGIYVARLSMEQYAVNAITVNIVTGMMNVSTYSELSREIASGGDYINLQYGYYVYDNGDSISISEDNKVIDGNGAVIDMTGSNIRAFDVISKGVTIKNLTIKNVNFEEIGGAIKFAGDSGPVINCNFINNAAKNGGAIYFDYTGNVENCSFVNNSATSDGGAVRMSSGNVTNCNFVNNSATYHGGAIDFKGSGNVTNCNFVNNSATYHGGAIDFEGSGNVTNCNFTDNKATDTYSYGGAVYLWNQGTVTNCNFTGNNATIGSAIYFYSSSATKTVSNSRFLNNRANAEALEITKNDNNITITFTGNNNLLNAIYSNSDVTFTNVTYWAANRIANTGSSPTTPARSQYEAGQNISVGVVVNGIIIFNEVKVTDENGMIVLDIKAGENYYISARHDTDSYYTETEKTNSTMKLNVNITSQTTTNRTVNITAKSNIPQDIVQGKLLFILPNGTNITANYAGNGTWWAVHRFDDYGVYQVSASYIGLDNVTINNATITVSKVNTVLTADAVTATYNINRDLVITLKDANGNALSGAKLTVDLNGAREYVTDANGQVKVNVAKLVPKTYTAIITFNGDDAYVKSAKNVQVIVKKAKAKIVAKKKTFKKSKKVKKYTVTLKDNTGKAIKKAKVTIKVGKKTFKATTNTKGKAVFKLKKLTKKAKYTAKVTYKGDKYYSKVTKKVKITIK